MHLLGSLLDATPPQAKKLELAKTVIFKGREPAGITAYLGLAFKM